MKTLRRYFLVLLVVNFTIITGFAQSGGKIQFEENTFNFGNIKEEEGPVTHEFSFKNVGDEPIAITNVRASCGCTTPGWTKEAIAPGETGYIKAQYNPNNRPGSFHKSLTVTTDGEPASVVLFISGLVMPKQRTPKEEFPKKIGGIRVANDKIDLGRITTKDSVTKEFKIFNDSEKTLVISPKVTAPKHISVTVESGSIEPNKAGTIKFTYNPTKKADFGDVTDQIIIETNETEENKKIFIIKASVAEFFPPMTDQELANAPKAELDKVEIDLGKVKAGSVQKTDVELKNSGKSELLVKKVKSTVAYINANSDKSSLKSGGQSKIKIQYTAPETAGPDSKVVYIYTNSPSSPVLTILIKAEVVK
ncbi:MAG: DUF1573 domain-containing protein [Cytophagaceae bacterium]